MNAAENVCPICLKSNEPESNVCGHCGAVLEDPYIDLVTVNSLSVISDDVKEWLIDETAVPNQGIAVYVKGEYTPVHVDLSREFFIGRRSGKTAPLAESLLDLSPQGGYGQGVSRRHVAIRRTEDGYEILDLGSSNGTWLNNERLTPHKNYPLPSGSHLRVGGMRLFVLYLHIADTE